MKGKSAETELSVRDVGEYTARVFAGIPLLGVCNIYQDLSATVFQYRVRSYELKGTSYVSGACLFAWDGNRSWAEKVGKIFNVYMKGTASAIIKGSWVSFSPTFKTIFEIKKNTLVQHFQ